MSIKHLPGRWLLVCEWAKSSNDLSRNIPQLFNLFIYILVLYDKDGLIRKMVWTPNDRDFSQSTSHLVPISDSQPQKLHPLLKFCPLPSCLVNSFEGLPLSDTSNHRPGRCLILTSHYQEIYLKIYLKYWTFLYIFWFYMIKDGLNFEYCHKIGDK